MRNRLRARIVAAQRQALVRMRATAEIGDDAFLFVVFGCEVYLIIRAKSISLERCIERYEATAALQHNWTSCKE